MRIWGNIGIRRIGDKHLQMGIWWGCSQISYITKNLNWVVSWSKADSRWASPKSLANLVCVGFMGDISTVYGCLWHMGFINQFVIEGVTNDPTNRQFITHLYRMVSKLTTNDMFVWLCLDRGTFLDHKSLVVFVVFMIAVTTDVWLLSNYIEHVNYVNYVRSSRNNCSFKYNHSRLTNYYYKYSSLTL